MDIVNVSASVSDEALLAYRSEENFADYAVAKGGDIPLPELEVVVNGTFTHTNHVCWLGLRYSFASLVHIKNTDLKKAGIKDDKKTGGWVLFQFSSGLWRATKCLLKEYHGFEGWDEIVKLSLSLRDAEQAG